MRVSVIVPVYNSGPEIKDLLASIDTQTIGTDRLEVVFVDDGSTNGIGEWLDAAAAGHAYVRVVHIPNSGWPGRPRNVGMDLARGKYVFFSDQDDALYRDALERMVSMADENGTDVVYGKVVRLGAGTPYWNLSRRDVGVTGVVEAGLGQSRTVHKLYRRAFLQQHRIRFPEGRVRLEDHHFMGQVLAHDPRVSLLSSVPCYRWVDRNDGTNNSARGSSAADYWGYYTEAMLLPWELGAPAEVAASITVSATHQAFSRAGIHKYPSHSPARRAKDLDALSTWARTAVPAVVDGDLVVLRRLRIQALRARDEPSFVALHGVRAALDPTVAVVRVVPTGRGRAVVSLDVNPGVAELIDWASDGTLEVRLPPEVVGEAYDPSVRGCDVTGVELSVRERVSGIEWPIGADQVPVDPLGSAVPARIEIDVERGLFGQPMHAGRWDLFARGTSLGEPWARRLRVPEGWNDVRVLDSPGGRVTMYRTLSGYLAINVTRRVQPPAIGDA